MAEFVAEDAVRADLFLSEKTGLTRSAVKKLAEEGHLFVDDVPVKAGHVVKAGNRVRLDVPAAPSHSGAARGHPRRRAV